MKRTESKVVCSLVGEHAFKPELDNAELRSEVKSSYPTRQANSDGLFTEDEYGLETLDFESTKVAFIDVPKGSTIESVQAKLDSAPNCRIQKIMSMKPILSEAQEAAIKKGLTTLETIAEAQTVKDKDGNVVLHNGQKFYKKNQLSINGAADIDMRPAKIETPVVAAAKVEENVDSIVK
jgi:hypothetical protein